MCVVFEVAVVVEGAVAVGFCDLGNVVPEFICERAKFFFFGAVRLCEQVGHAVYVFCDDDLVVVGEFLLGAVGINALRKFFAGGVDGVVEPVF